MKVLSYFIVKNFVGLSFTLRFFTLVAARSENGIEPYTSFTLVLIICLSNVLIKERVHLCQLFRNLKMFKCYKSFLKTHL